MLLYDQNILSSSSETFGYLWKFLENVQKCSSGHGLRTSFEESSKIVGKCSLHSLMRYQVEHSEIKFVSTRGHAISSMYFHVKWRQLCIFFTTRAVLKIGEYHLDISHFDLGIFSHVIHVHLDQ